jgi:hypothetical protein
MDKLETIHDVNGQLVEVKNIRTPSRRKEYKLSQHEVNVIHSVLANNLPTISDDNQSRMRAPALLRHLTILAVLKKLPSEELTREEYFEAHAEHNVHPSEDYARSLPPSTQV